MCKGHSSLLGCEIYSHIKFDILLIPFYENAKYVVLPRPRHFHCLPLFTVADIGKNWKCPGLGVTRK